MIKKAIVWGVGLHQHTNSYVYAGFYKAFKHMGFDAYWLNKDSDVSGMDFSNSLFITEGQHDANIPLRNDCKYVIHNCGPKYAQALPCENYMSLQVYTNDVIKHGAKKVEDGVYFLKTDSNDRVLFQPWATDLLPHEIDLEWAKKTRTRRIHWIGTIGGGQFGNENEINAFKAAAAGAGVSFHHRAPGSTSFEENKTLIQQSYLAPSIHGTWQTQNGYIACRVFKNISYGHLGCTNSKMAHEVLQGKMVLNGDPRQLFFDARAMENNVKFIQEAMAIVRDKHTYVNRVKSILAHI